MNSPLMNATFSLYVEDKGEFGAAVGEDDGGQGDGQAGAALHRHLQGHPPQEAVVTPVQPALPCNVL